MSHDALISELALANRLLVNEDVLDTFGHVSCRHPDRPDRYFLAAALAPVTVGPADILEFDLDGALLTPSDRPLYSERVIHSEIYRARPDVAAIVHHHAPAGPAPLVDERLGLLELRGAELLPDLGI